MLKIKSLFVPTALALLVSACTSTNPVTESIKSEAYARSEFYVNKISQTTNKEDQQSYRLLAVRKLLDENKLEEAKNLFAEIRPELNETQKIEYNLISAQLASLQGNNPVATQQLKLVPFAQLSRPQAIRYYQTFAKIAENKNDVIEAVRMKTLAGNYLADPKARQENNDQIWALLRGANRGMLEKTNVEAGEVGLAGWLSLINTYNQNITQPLQLQQAINEWKRQYPSHSAAIIMPSDLQNVATFQQTVNQNIALLLPLSGNGKVLGEMVKKGFDDAKGDDSTPIQLFDTDSNTADSLISQAKQQGAQAVVGPLIKERIEQAMLSPDANGINLLALNVPNNVRSAKQVCYYGLSPESEARSAANKLFSDRISQAIVAAPQGDYGQRAADAFAQRWLELTRTDADVRYYNSPLDALVAIQNAGGSTQGKALYILGTAEQVAELKQGIDNSELAGKFPIYTSSRSNSPNNGPDFRLTMEGVKFSEIPLLANPTSEYYKRAEQLAGGDFSMMRLYAMGSDAWVLSSKFNELRQIPGYSISGLTGKLSAGKNCVIERGMTWLEYRNGEIMSAD